MTKLSLTTRWRTVLSCLLLGAAGVLAAASGSSSKPPETRKAAPPPPQEEVARFDQHYRYCGEHPVHPDF